MVIISPSDRLLRLIAGVMGIKALCKASPQLIPMSDPIPILSSSPGLIRSYPLSMLGSSVVGQQWEHGQHSWGYSIKHWEYNVAHWRYNLYIGGTTSQTGGTTSHTGGRMSHTGGITSYTGGTMPYTGGTTSHIGGVTSHNRGTRPLLSHLLAWGYVV